MTQISTQQTGDHTAAPLDRNSLAGSKPPAYIVPALLALFAIAAAFVLNDLSLYTPDSTRYLIWARSLAEFRGFVDATLPEPQHYVIHAPLYAILLAPIAFLFPYGVVAAKCLSILFGILFLFTAYRWLAGRVGERIAVIGLLILACSPLTLLYSTEVLSEIPFALLLVLAFTLYEKSRQEHEAFYTGMLIAVVTAAMLVREVGIALLAAAVLALVLDGKRKTAALLAVTALAVYAIWYVRNEIVVAGREQPALTNAGLFFGHYFSPAGSGFMNEVVERAGTNARLYGLWFMKLLFTPLVPGTEYRLVDDTSGIFGLLRGAMPVVTVVTAVIGLAAAVWGTIVDLRKPVSLLGYLFIPCYALLILLYPINDIRFLFPLLVILVRAVCIGVADMAAGGIPSVPRAAVFPVLALALVPNIAWDIQYAANSYSYRHHSPTEGVAAANGLPWHFSRPFSAAAASLKNLVPENTVLLARRKDLALSLPGRKLAIFDANMPVASFDTYLRDYRVPYIVNVVQPNGIRDFEFQMMESRHFRFRPVERIGNIEIAEVEPLHGSSAQPVPLSTFGRGISLLDGLRYAEAESLFSAQLAGDPASMAALFYRGVTREFAGNLEHAADDFTKLRTLPQAGAFLVPAQLHQSILAALKSQQGPFSPAAKADQGVNIAVEYWNEGFHSRARLMIASALRFDSLHLPGILYGIFYALQDGDTTEARRLYHAGHVADSTQPAVKAWKRYFALVDSLSAVTQDSGAVHHLPLVAAQMVDMGMTEGAIDLLLQQVHLFPDDLGSMMTLADLYLNRSRYLPAAQMLNGIMTMNPHYPGAREKVQSLGAHFH